MRGSYQVRTCTPRRRHRRGGGYHGLRDPPWGVRGSTYILGTPALRPNIRKTSPLSWFENQQDLLEGCKKPRLHSCLLTQKTRWRKQIETTQGSGQFPMAIPAHAPACTRNLLWPLFVWCSFPLR